MKLRDINFPPALGASGVQGFFGNNKYNPEYKHSKIIRAILGDIFSGMGFVAKTATTNPNKGNVELASNGFSFKKFLPNAIYPMPLKNAALNAISLSNPGFKFLIEKEIWQHKLDPFMLSFMPIGKTKEERIKEVLDFVRLMAGFRSYSDFALQVNLSCPNTDHVAQGSLVEEASSMLKMLSILNVPLIPKINVLLDPQIALKILLGENCDALCVSNTIPFGQMADRIDWYKYSNEDYKSPLEEYGYPAGGLSGAPLFPLLVEWLEKFSDLAKGINKPIIAGGGVMRRKDVQTLSEFNNVEAVSIGSVAFLKPWRVPGIIAECYKRFQ